MRFWYNLSNTFFKGIKGQELLKIPLKIAIVTNNYKPYSGGVVSSIDSFANELRLLGHEVLIVTLDFLGNGQSSDHGVFRIYCPIRFMYKNNHMAVPWRADKVVYSLLKEFAPDIIHSQHPFLLGVSALKASKSLGIPLVFTYHTQYEKYLHYVPLPTVFTFPTVKKLANNYCNQVDGIIAPSQSIYNYLISSNIKQIQIIPSGILPIFLSDKLNIRKNKPFHLLTVSRFTKEKNIYFLLDVFSKLDQNEFIFTLIGYGAELKPLQEYAYKHLNLSPDKIKFIEKPNKSIIASYYNSSDVFIFSSVTETQGLVLAEALAGGTPVIALNAAGSCDVIQNGVNGFLVETKEEMINKINLLSQDSVLHERLQYGAWATGNEFSPKNMTQKLVDFYFTIIKSKSNN